MKVFFGSRFICAVSRLRFSSLLTGPIWVEALISSITPMLRISGWCEDPGRSIAASLAGCMRSLSDHGTAVLRAGKEKGLVWQKAPEGPTSAANRNPRKTQFFPFKLFRILLCGRRLAGSGTNIKFFLIVIDGLLYFVAERGGSDFCLGRYLFPRIFSFSCNNFQSRSIASQQGCRGNRRPLF